ncbi:putative toxin-antitoxin system toxin component, PIN family [Niveispirillum sp. KHB5.9]|uniref:putative toxin-antitoxin system toxin component, PIN family n=1 Tax=Niveispirillum sp. KHB5.9 TaxID=3400269 RepID=UPI003A8B111D
MRVVLDTNVLLSALLSTGGAPDMIYRAWRAARFSLVTSDIQLDEVRRASRYPKLKAILQPHRVGAMINNMQRALVLDTLPPLPDDINVQDPHDAYLVTMVLAAGADYLVTGDRRAGLLRHGHVGRTRILTPKAFCEVAL